MKLPSFLRKPRWLSKDAAIRRNAVAHDHEPELVANLGRLAREDSDADVRIAAMKRLADPGIAQGLARDDADAGVRAQARALWLDLLVGVHASSPDAAERLRLLKAQDDNELIERIARQAREPELRRAALDRVSRPALLAERALDDGDAGIRLALVERIDDEAQLARLAERARKSDKQVNRAARERIEALRIARGDDATLEQRARSLCEQIEQVVRDPVHADTETAIAERWREIEARVPDALRTRYETAHALLAASRNPAPKIVATIPATIEAPADAALETTADAASEFDHDEPPVAAHEASPVHEAVAPLLAQARFAASLDHVNEEQRKKREQERVHLTELGDALRALDTAIESGAITAAHAAKARTDELRRRIESPLPRGTAQHLAESEQRHAELSRWQHWADDQRREQLCESVETLAASGAHPDAVATRVREAQAEWSRLDAAEGRGTARPSPLARRFHAACRAAFAPAQDYFRKRQELRQSHAQQVQALLERAGALPDENKSDWSAALSMRREVADALRDLDRVEPRERKALAQRLKGALAALDTRIERHDADVERAKAALIAEAETLAQTAPRGAVAAVRDLQQRWREAGNGRRGRDQAQWKAFRAAIDSVFGRLDADRAERNARDTEAREQAEALCAELETLATAETPDRAAATRLRAAWDALRVRDDDLVHRFAVAQAALQEATKRRDLKLRNARFDAWLARYHLCRAAERSTQSADALSAHWQEAPATDIAAATLAARFDAAVAGAPSDSGAADEDAFHDALVDLELLAGVESPDADRERRRTRQVGRLSARMSGGHAADPSRELANLLARWSELGPAADATFDARLEIALLAALQALH